MVWVAKEADYLAPETDLAREWILTQAEEMMKRLQRTRAIFVSTGSSTGEFTSALTDALRFIQGTNLSLTDWGRLTHNQNIDVTTAGRFDAYGQVLNLLKGVDPFDQWKLTLVPLLRQVIQIAGDGESRLAGRAQTIIYGLSKLGLDPSLIANDTSDKLTAFFVDGTYNFTYILFPTAVLQNGFAGTGTCVISSNYNVNTQLLDKKSLINSFSDPQPQTILQSFDINSNSIVMDTYGSSLSGKFGFKEDGSALNTIDTGYDATYGTFTTFYRFYIKTQIGFLISNYNRDTDELHSVWFYSIVPKATDEPPPPPLPRRRLITTFDAQ
jgi:hypothetical protein